MSENYIVPKKQDIDKVKVPENAEFYEEMKLLLHLTRDYPDEVDLELNMPVSEEEIDEFEKKTGIILTDELKEFFLFTNGLSLYPSALNISTLAQIEKDLDLEWEWGDTKNYICLGDIIGDGEAIFLDLDTNTIVTNDHGEEVVFDTFAELLVDVIFTFIDGEVEDDELEEYVNDFEETESDSD